jgi:hypothetical protein
MFSNTCAMTLAQKSDRILAQTRGLSGATPNATQLIEELRWALEENRREVERLTTERDEARRSVCEMSIQLGGVYRRVGGKIVEVTTPEGCAEIMRWDCFNTPEAKVVKTLNGVIIDGGKAVPPKYEDLDNE